MHDNTASRVGMSRSGTRGSKSYISTHGNRELTKYIFIFFSLGDSNLMNSWWYQVTATARIACNKCPSLTVKWLLWRDVGRHWVILLRFVIIQSFRLHSSNTDQPPVNGWWILPLNIPRSPRKRIEIHIFLRAIFCSSHHTINLSTKTAPPTHKSLDSQC